MSGALIQLVSKGVQDVYLIGDPQDFSIPSKL